MSTPLIVNRAPAPRTTGGVSESIRFSVRDQDAEALRTTIQCHLGFGSAFWDGDVLPEDDPRTVFTLRSRVSSPSNPAVRSIVGNDLKLEKLVAANQEAMYEFGGLQAPAAPDAPLMLEFELTLAAAGVVVDAQNWSGVFAGLKSFNKGVAIKFVDDGTKRVEIHDANPSVTTPTLTAIYDWDAATSHIFKLLWHPQLDLLRLYVSTGPDAQTSDVLLLDGLVSSIPDLPSNEIPAVQPIGFFGVGSIDATSTSLWSSMHLYNTVTQPVVDGVSRGGHEGFLRTDESVLYDASDLPRKVGRPWIILPGSFGTIGGEEVLASEGHLILRRSSLTESIGFFRVEPKVIVGPTILDFRVWGRLNDRPPGVGTASGIEIYIDDGTKKTVMVFLDDGLTKEVGLELGSSQATGWGTSSLYRIIMDPIGTSRILVLSETDDGRLESELVGLAYSSLPASDMPGPGIGFLHNANSVQALAEMFLSWLRYSTDVIMWEAFTGLPTAPWTKLGAGPTTLDADIMTLTTTNESTVFRRPETTFDSKGLFIEAVFAVDTYTVGSAVDPARTIPGAAISIDDGTNNYQLVLADGGPEFGKIVFLLSDSSLDPLQNLVDIRAGKAAVAGTWFAVDWSQFHHYRLERSVSGDLVVYLDHNPTPVIQFDWQEFTAPASVFEGAFFGHSRTDRSAVSRWQSVRYGRSHGYDVEALPTVEELRYDHAINSIVEVDS